jgi:hypothetical protein
MEHPQPYELPFAKVLRRQRDGIAFNRYKTGNGRIIYKHAGALGGRSIV